MIVIRPLASLAKVKTINAIKALARRGPPLAKAKRAVEDMVDHGRAELTLDAIDSHAELARDLQAAGVRATRVAVRDVDVRELRDRLGLTQEAFAERFGFNVRTVQGWEQGRDRDATANVALLAIEHNADSVAQAIEQPLTD